MAEDDKVTIAEVCKKYGMTADTLRYYERVGLIPKVGRTVGGIRNYAEQDCLWIEFIKCMRGAGVQVESMIEYVALFQQGESTSEARKQILIKERDRIAEHIKEMQDVLERLNYKIEVYYNAVMPAESKLTTSVA
jgi:DNA-binding transcriptional MerR regulator